MADAWGASSMAWCEDVHVVGYVVGAKTYAVLLVGGATNSTRSHRMRWRLKHLTGVAIE